MRGAPPPPTRSCRTRPRSLKHAVWAMSRVRVMDGGPDGVAATGDNTTFLTQGLFVP